jgi:hypothetical protein
VLAGRRVPYKNCQLYYELAERQDAMEREYSRVRSQRPIRSVLLEAWCETYCKFISIGTFAREVALFSYHSKAKEIVILQQCLGVEHSSGKVGEVDTSERVHSTRVSSNAVEVEML